MDLDALARLREDPIDWRYKGFPPTREHVTPATVRDQGWNLLAGDIPTPVLVLRESALRHNLDLMARWCEAHDVSLAPHGKTTMSPELYELQLQAGAWGITAANVAQVRVYRAFGIQRVVLANELVEPVSLRWVAEELAADPSFDFYCLVDSVEAVRAMDAALPSLTRPIQVLVELGVTGGRTGARTVEDALAVAAEASDSTAVDLAGVEAFEGVIHGDDALERVDELLDRLRLVLQRLDVDARDEVIISAGGSAWFDRVDERLRAVEGARVVLRSGCYLTHDSGIYESQSPLGARAPAGGERLRPALEVWGAVLSRPEPELALVLSGKRDVPYDVGLPTPMTVSDGNGLRAATGMTVTDLNDQHLFVRVPADDPLAVGDLLGCGISHPCTAFDKWRLIPVVDDESIVVDAVHTFF